MLIFWTKNPKAALFYTLCTSVVWLVILCGFNLKLLNNFICLSLLQQDTNNLWGSNGQIHETRETFALNNFQLCLTCIYHLSIFHARGNSLFMASVWICDCQKGGGIALLAGALEIVLLKTYLTWLYWEFVIDMGALETSKIEEKKLIYFWILGVFCLQRHF